MVAATAPPPQTDKPAGAPPPPPPQDEGVRIRSELVATYSLTLAWILLSAGVVVLNKYALELFPFPLTLTAAHQAFCSAAASGALKWSSASASARPASSSSSSLPLIGALFAASLGAGNAAYLRLELHLIQTLKALTPLAVCACGLLLGVERWRASTVGAAALVAAGVALASAHEARLDGAGVALQLGSVACEAARLVLVQRALSSAVGGETAAKPSASPAPPQPPTPPPPPTPLQMMALVSPICLALLLPAAALLEGRRLLLVFGVAAARAPPLLLLLASAAAAFSLNLAAFSLVKRAGALALNLAGVVKDALLIAASAVVFGAAVRPVQVVGYLVALSGVTHYNWSKVVARAKGGGGGASVGATSARVVVPAAAADDNGEQQAQLRARESSGGGMSGPVRVRAVAGAAALVGRGATSGGGGKKESGGGGGGGGGPHRTPG